VYRQSLPSSLARLSQELGNILTYSHSWAHGSPSARSGGTVSRTVRSAHYALRVTRSAGSSVRLTDWDQTARGRGSVRLDQPVYVSVRSAQPVPAARAGSSAGGDPPASCPQVTRVHCAARNDRSDASAALWRRSGVFSGNSVFCAPRLQRPGLRLDLALHFIDVEQLYERKDVASSDTAVDTATTASASTFDSRLWSRRCRDHCGTYGCGRSWSRCCRSRASVTDDR
jgi:hypothetical protein